VGVQIYLPLWVSKSTTKSTIQIYPLSDWLSEPEQYGGPANAAFGRGDF